MSGEKQPAQVRVPIAAGSNVVPRLWQESGRGPGGHLRRSKVVSLAQAERWLGKSERACGCRGDHSQPPAGPRPSPFGPGDTAPQADCSSRGGGAAPSSGAWLPAGGGGHRHWGPGLELNEATKTSVTKINNILMQKVMMDRIPTFKALLAFLLVLSPVLAAHAAEGQGRSGAATSGPPSCPGGQLGFKVTL